MSINQKNKFGQFLCRHKKTGWYTDSSLFQTISGETHYLICQSCGKQLEKRFLEYEGMGFK